MDDTYRILAHGHAISNDTWQTGLNNNDLIIGPSGSGKTRGYVKPNILQCSESMVITDTKGALRPDVGTALEQQGYKVVEINLADCDSSPCGYNPLACIRQDREGHYREQDILTLAACMVPVGMPEELKGQVSPDMSVRAINRLKKGGPEPGTVADSPAPVEEPAPIKETEKEPDAEKEDENPAAEEDAVSDDTVHEEMQEAESPGTAEVSAARLEAPEDTETMGTENHGDDAEGHTQEAANSEGDTLAEIDSYTDYQSMADELDLLMRTVFSADASVRVKIVCVQG